jgi:hypothetical protein
MRRRERGSRMVLSLASLSLAGTVSACDTAPSAAEDVEAVTSALHQPAEYAFLWNHLASNSVGVSYAPHPDYARNSTGGLISVQRTGVGFYNVVLGGLDAANTGITHVVAHGNDDKRCSNGSVTWTGVNTEILVICFNPNGTHADSRWILTHTRRDASVSPFYYAHLYHHAPEAPVGVDSVPTVRTFNSAGGTNVVTRTGAGQYTVKLSNWPAGSVEAGTVQVTHNAFSGLVGWKGSCQVSNWTFLSGGRVHIFVVCMGENGLPTNNYFNLTFSNLSAAGGRSAGYAFANDPSSPLYTPTASKRMIQIDGTAIDDTIQIQNPGTGDHVGKYDVFYNSSPSLNGLGSVPLVTSVGSAGEYCKIESWGASAVVNLRCRNRLGTPLDVKFASAYVTDQP